MTIRKVILQIDPTFQNNTSWRFVDEDYSFPNPADPFAEAFPEVININNIPANVLTADFIAVKVGDVNASASTNGLLGSDDRNTVGEFVLQVEDRLIRKGEKVTVDFVASELEVLGYQFTLNFDRNALQFIELVPGVAQDENFGFTLLDKGAITSSWNGEGAANELAFGLTFVANADISLSEVLSLNSRFTTAEAYNTSGELLDVALGFNNNTVANGFELYQNTPNPFNNETIIGFSLPEAGSATLTVTDVSGKVLSVVEGEFAKGFNQIRLDANSLPVTGLLYYTLETSDDIATKKMIVTK